MSPEIEKQIVSLIAQQATDVTAQLIRWKIGDGILSVFLGVALILVGIKLLRYLYKNWNELKLDEVVWFPAGIAVVVMCVGGFTLAFDGGSQLVQAILAPKVLILETISGLAHRK